jgi:hypothetical protein
MELTFASPGWAVVGLALALPLVALVLTEHRAGRVRALLHLRRPDSLALAAPAVALALVGGLVAVAAAQPVLVVRDEQLIRRDAEVYLIIDNSRSMLATSAPGEPNRFERAKRIAVELRRAFPDLPIGLASMTDRLLLHLFPTTSTATYGATLQRAMGVDRPPPRLPSKRATALSAAAEATVWNYFSDAARQRIAVVMTDGEGQTNDPENMRSALRDGVRARFLFLHVWDEDEQVFGPDDEPESGYAADPGSFGLLSRVAEAARGRAYREGQMEQLRSDLARGLPAPKPTDIGRREEPRPLAPYAAAAAFLPLAFLLRRRNRA